MPTVDDLEGSALPHRFGDHFNPPGLTNFLGCVQADLDPVALRCLSFPPLSTADTVTGALFVDGRWFASLGVPVSYQWRPDRIVREAQWDAWSMRTTTVLPFGDTAVVVQIEVENQSGAARTLPLRFVLRGGVTNRPGPWLTSSPPSESIHDVAVDAARGAVAFAARTSGAVSLQGCRPRPALSDDALSVTLDVPAGGTKQASFVVALGPDASAAGQTFDALIERVPAVVAETRREWDREIEAIFTPGSGRYGGNLPLLETSDEAVRRVYLMGAVGTIYFRRDSPASAVGRAYDTLMPRYWQTVTFLWDYSLSSRVHAMLDPQVMRRHLELWMTRDIHTCFGTEWLTGGPVGGWYSVNDYAMVRMMADYLRFSGDFGWLDTSAGGRDVGDRLTDYATGWRRFEASSGLADYGGIGNLLECVSTYVNQIAALNAANAWSMRFAATVAGARGDAAAAERLRADAGMLAKRVQELYVDGGGYWNTRRPDGTLVPVKHCYDFQTVLACIPDDLGLSQKAEMAGFFERELMTPAWMRALSASDPDAAFDIRPDHQWTGAYPAWPPQAVKALWTAGRPERGLEWLRGLAASANQGPYGQAHFSEDAMAPDESGARKSPSDFPWICDWACSSSGSFVEAVIESIFGVDARLDGIDAHPVFAGFDPDARLRNLPWQGRLFDVTRDGIAPAVQP